MFCCWVAVSLSHRLMNSLSICRSEGHWVSWSVTLAQSFAAGLNEQLSGRVPVWLTEFWGLYPAEGLWGVLWSVILDRELCSGREFESPNNFWASPTRRLWLAAALIWNNTPLKGRDRLNCVKWRGDGQHTKPAITTKWMSTDYWTLWHRWWIWPRPRSEAANRREKWTTDHWMTRGRREEEESRPTHQVGKWQEREKIIPTDLHQTDGAELCGGVTKADKICSWQNG